MGAGKTESAISMMQEDKVNAKHLISMFRKTSCLIVAINKSYI